MSVPCWPALKELMSENLKEQKLLRKLEIESLTNQIKPHFIYNTLDMIIGQLEQDQTEEAIYLIEALRQLFPSQPQSGPGSGEGCQRD